MRGIGRLTKSNRKRKGRAAWYNSNSWFNPLLTPKERSEYIAVARQLGYPSEVLDALRKATTEIECDAIMKDARARL